jgi:hypothetical protein
VATTEDTHVNAWSAEVNYFWFEAVHEEPGAIALVLVLVKMPAPLISHCELIEAISSGEACFANANSELAKATEELSEVDIPVSKPFLNITSRLEMDWVRCTGIPKGNACTTSANELLDFL